MKKPPLKSENKEEYSDLASGIFALALAVVLFITTLSHTVTFSNSSIGPVTIPRAISIVIFVLGLILIVKWAAGRKKVHKAPASAGAEEKSRPQKSAEERKLELFRRITAPGTFLLITVYLLLMKKIGFTLSSCLYITLQISLLSADVSPKRILKAFIIGVVSSVVIYMLFAKVFQLYLPTARWGF